MTIGGFVRRSVSCRVLDESRTSSHKPTGSRPFLFISIP